MASPYYHGVFMFFIATTIVVDRVSSYDRLNSLRSNSKATRSVENFQNSAKSAMEQVSKASTDFAADGILQKLIINTAANDRLTLSALESCRVQISMAMNNLNNSFHSPEITSDEAVGNLGSWMCATGDDLQTCLDGFEHSDFRVKDFVSTALKSPIDSVKRSREFVHKFNMWSGRGVSSGRGHPSWLSTEDNELIGPGKRNPNIVVAQDGTGDYKTISEAVKVAPYSSNERFFIYVKNGTYYENVKIDVYQWNVVMSGDGMNTTMVVGNRSVGGGYNPFTSATFSVLGQGFVARDMGFYNTAGAKNQQAVALVSAADKSVFYRCRIDGYQDTLYAKNNRQFYRECYIYGTIDFIFGLSAVIQKSTILARKPLPGQMNFLTAQGKTDRHCQEGITIQDCDIVAAEDLSGVETFLGRPWKFFSQTVFMQNYMDALISPAGWMSMNERRGAPPPPNTVFLAEYANRGPGANVSGRVNWSGVRVDLSSDEASRYTVHSLINGDEWLPRTNVTYQSGL